MPNLITTTKTATTETRTYDDGTTETVKRVAYVTGKNDVHTEHCPAVQKALASDNQDLPSGWKEMDLAEAIEPIDNGLQTDLTECRACDKLRAAANYPNADDGSADKKEGTMPTKTADKIEMPASIKKPTATLTAVLDAINRGYLGPTAEIASASGVTIPAANSALLALESAGVLQHEDVGTGKNKVRAWALKEAPAAKAPAKKATAAELKATMDAKIAANKAAKAAKAAASPAPAAKKSAAAPKAASSGRVPTGVRQEKALEYLQQFPNVPKSVLHIEEGCGYPVRTLAGVLARMAEKGGFDIVRANTDTGRRGFMYVPPKAVAAKKAAAKKAT